MRKVPKRTTALSFLQQNKYKYKYMYKGGMWVGKGKPHLEINMRGEGSSTRIKAILHKNNTVLETMDQHQGKLQR
jgi:hypothetical protein